MGTWDKVKKLLGFGPDCLNGGQKDNVGNCNCPDHYEGKTCELILCANHGVANAARTRCHCPDSHRYYGVHCQLTRCDNNGKDTGDGRCECVDDWYTGDFCQHYSSPWGIVFGVAGAALLALVILCVLCRLMPCCPPTGGRQRRRRRRSSSELPPRPSSRPLPAPPPSSQPPPYAAPLHKPQLPPPAYYDVVRDLDKYPTSNPRLPPPSAPPPPLDAVQPLLPPSALEAAHPPPPPRPGQQVVNLPPPSNHPPPEPQGQPSNLPTATPPGSVFLLGGGNSVPRLQTNPIAYHCDERSDYTD